MPSPKALSLIQLKVLQTTAADIKQKNYIKRTLKLQS